MHFNNTDAVKAMRKIGVVGVQYDAVIKIERYCWHFEIITSYIAQHGAGIITAAAFRFYRRIRQVRAEWSILMCCIWDAAFIAGERGSRIEQKYITPIIVVAQIELIALYPENPEQAKLLEKIRESFRLSGKEFGYEKKLRAMLSDIWCDLLTLPASLLEEKEVYDKTNDKI